MNIKIGYGGGVQELDIDSRNILDILLPNEYETNLTEEEIISLALNKPIGSQPVEDIVKKGESVVIITSDITRPVPSARILPHLLDRLEKAGVERENLTIVFALGSHRSHTEPEMRKLAGEDIFNAYKCVDANPLDYISLGTTKNGTPVDIDRTVAEADRRICIGNIEYHYFAGYSGGAKAIMPGCSTKKAIRMNHSMMVCAGAEAAVVCGNPVRDDLEEAVKKCPIDFIVNVVLNEKKEIIYAVAGDYIKAHREGCKLLDSVYSSKITQKADIVIASQGGSPKDINLYQLQKALDNAKNAVKKGGIIILAGECKEGYGEAVFERWMKEAVTPESIIERISKGFELGGHKAAAIAMVLKMADIYLVSDFDSGAVQNMFMKPFKTVCEAYKEAMKVKGGDAGVIVMPYAGSTLPVYETH